MVAEDWCLAEEKALNTAPFLPSSTDLPQKNQGLPELVTDKRGGKASCTPPATG
jgi:hypothetical protein